MKFVGTVCHAVALAALSALVMLSVFIYTGFQFYVPEDGSHYAGYLVLISNNVELRPRDLVLLKDGRDQELLSVFDTSESKFITEDDEIHDSQAEYLVAGMSVPFAGYAFRYFMGHPLECFLILSGLFTVHFLVAFFASDRKDGANGADGQGGLPPCLYTEAKGDRE